MGLSPSPEQFSGMSFERLGGTANSLAVSAWKFALLDKPAVAPEFGFDTSFKGIMA